MVGVLAVAFIAAPLLTDVADAAVRVRTRGGSNNSGSSHNSNPSPTLSRDLGKPTNLHAWTNGSKVHLDWDYNHSTRDVTSFWIMRSKDSTGNNWKRVGSVGRNETDFIDTSARRGETYFYRVRVNADGKHSWSNMIQLKGWKFGNQTDW